eukprot:6103544-Pleurochrysis_carterae.AAC.1
MPQFRITGLVNRRLRVILVQDPNMLQFRVTDLVNRHLRVILVQDPNMPQFSITDLVDDGHFSKHVHPELRHVELEMNTSGCTLDMRI